MHGILAWIIPVFVLSTASDREHQTTAFWEASFVAFSVVVLTVHLKLVIIAVQPMKPVGILVITAELLGYMIVAVFLSYDTKFNLAPQLKGVPAKVVTSWRHLACLVGVPCVSVIADIVDAYFSRPTELGGASPNSPAIPATADAAVTTPLCLARSLPP